MANWFDDQRWNVLDGCYYQQHKYDINSQGAGRLHNEAISAETHKECQQKCQEDASCYYFTFYSNSKKCYKLGEAAIYENSAPDAICGPKTCPTVPSGCYEIAKSGFPGSTPDETESLFPSHRQPAKLECWPRNDQAGGYDTCKQRTVLEDSKYGWPAFCQGLTARTGPERKAETPELPAGETCESDCIKDPLCAVWVIVNDDNKACWQGTGEKCFQRKGFVGVVEAQRIMHGEVRVLANITGIQICENDAVCHLTKAFDSNYFVKQDPDAISACRNHCYSNLQCQYWQYSSITGCWTEEANINAGTDAVPYPLTTSVATKNSRMAKFIMAGEYIQHVCKGVHNVPDEFSAARTPDDLDYVKPAETVAEVYREYQQAYPEVHGAPVTNNHQYGTDTYHETYESAGMRAKAAALAPAPSMAPSPPPVQTQVASGAQIDPTIAAAIAATNAPVPAPSTMTIAKYEVHAPVSVAPAGLSPVAFFGAGLVAFAALSVLAVRRSRRHPSLSVNVALSLDTTEQLAEDQQTDTERPLMGSV